ncbi:MAG TPA: ABC transporter substrate-binding protein [Methylomirabilota bacterium]|jgi:putative ABC transport system substrate-binding protein
MIPGQVRARFLLNAVLVALPFCLAETGWAQAGHPLKIGILTDAMTPWHSTTEGFRDGLKELGYDGRNVVFEAYATRGERARLPVMAAALLGQKPDVIFCVADACSRANGDVPMVFSQVSDPVRLGLVESVARPGGNITGIANLRADLTGKRLELFKETVPSLRRVLVSYDPREEEEQASVGSAKTAAQRLGLLLVDRPITTPLEIETGLAQLREGGQDGILIVQSGTNLNIPGRTLEVATSNKIPTMYPSSFWTRVGALVSYGADQYLQGKQAARLAGRILMGTKPQNLPVELPDRIELVVNLKTAKRVGLNVPQAVLLRADRVIQ